MMYRRFTPLLTSLLGVFLLLSFVSTYAQANSALFTVRGVEVDVTDTNALKAREKAFEQAQIKAFETLIDRLAQNSQAQIPDVGTVSAMIRDYEVTEEKLSTVRYVGTYTFRFKSEAVKNYFSGKSLNYTDIGSEPILILPYYNQAGRFNLWSHTNSWKKAWDKVDTFNALVPIVIPVGDIQDVSDIQENNSLSYNPSALKNLLSRYDAREAVIAVAVPDSGFSQDGKANDPARGSLSINLYRTDKDEPLHVKQFFVSAKPGQTRSDLLNKAVKDVQNILSQNWKEQTLVAAQQTNALTAHIPIRSLAQWTKIESKLNAITTINKVSLQKLSPNKAVVDITYVGDPDRLRLALSRSRLGLTEQATPYGLPPVYQILSL